MSERILTTDVQSQCEWLGLYHHHCPDSRRCEGPRGMPDMTIVGPGGFLLAELKDEDGDTSPSQDAWLYTLHRAKVPYVVWRPQDWDAGVIQEQLEALRSG